MGVSGTLFFGGEGGERWARRWVSLVFLTSVFIFHFSIELTGCCTVQYVETLFSMLKRQISFAFCLTRLFKKLHFFERSSRFQFSSCPAHFTHKNTLVSALSLLSIRSLSQTRTRERRTTCVWKVPAHQRAVPRAPRPRHLHLPCDQRAVPGAGPELRKSPS